MSYVGFGLGETKARGPDYQYLGVGETLVEIVKTKVKDRTNFIFEFRVLEDSRAFRGQPGEHRAGDEVSYCCNAGGTGDRAAMGKQDLKGTLIAILQSTGNDPRELSEAGWDTLMSNLFPDHPREAGQGPADGVRLIATGYRRTNNATGEIYKIPNMSFKAVPGQAARPQIVKGFGVPTGAMPAPVAGRPAPAPGRPATAPPARAAAAGPSQAQLTDVEQAVIDFVSNGWTSAELFAGTDENVAQLRTWALAEVGAEHFKAFVKKHARNDDIPF